MKKIENMTPEEITEISTYGKSSIRLLSNITGFSENKGEYIIHTKDEDDISTNDKEAFDEVVNKKTFYDLFKGSIMSNEKLDENVNKGLDRLQETFQRHLDKQLKDVYKTIEKSIDRNDNKINSVLDVVQKKNIEEISKLRSDFSTMSDNFRTHLIEIEKSSNDLKDNVDKIKKLKLPDIVGKLKTIIDKFSEIL